MQRPTIALVAALALGAPAAAQTPYGFVLRLGNDTIGVERVTPTPTGFVAELIERAPRVVRSRYEVVLDRDGGMQKFDLSQLVMNPAGRPASRTLVERTNHLNSYAAAYSVRVYRADSLLSKTDTTVGNAVVPWLLNGSAAYELAFQTARRQGGDSVIVSSISGGSSRFGRLVLKRTGTTTFTYPFFLGQKFYATMDEAGRLTAFSGRETTIKVEVERVAVAPPVDSIAARWTEREKADGIARDLSARDTARLALPLASVVVDYGRPLARGRTILGGVVPLNEVWRTGANAATHITLSAPMLVGGKVLAAGTYTIWTLPARDGATLLVNSQRGVWGTSYDATKDVIRVPLTTRTATDAPERMTIEVLPLDRGRMELRIQWGNLDWAVRLECATATGAPRGC